MDARGARQARARLGSRRPCRAARCRGAHDLPRLRLRARAARPGRGGARTAPRGRRDRRRAPRPPCRCRSSSRCTATCWSGRAGRRRRGGNEPSSAAIDRLLETNGLSVDLESAVYRADHRLAPEATVRLARRAQADRPSIHGDDALGWALARAGRCARRRRWLDRSLRLGTKDALLFFHRGYAAGCAGDRQAMRGVVPQGARARPELLDPLGPRGSPRTRAEPIPRGERRSRMKRLAVVLAVAVTALVATGVAAAHPLGNFTTNHYAEVVLSGDRAYVHYVLDLAEIPTFQARGDVTAARSGALRGSAGDGGRVRSRRLRRRPERAAWSPSSAGSRSRRAPRVSARPASSSSSPPAACVAGAEHSVSVRNEVYAERLGWRELVIRADGGATIAELDRAEPRDQRAPPLLSAGPALEPTRRAGRRSAVRTGRRRGGAVARAPLGGGCPPNHRPPPRVALPARSRNRS